MEGGREREREGSQGNIEDEELMDKSLSDNENDESLKPEDTCVPPEMYKRRSSCIFLPISLKIYFNFKL